MKRGQHRKSLDKLFQGFKPAVESCYFNWEVAYPLEGITYSGGDKKSATFCRSRAVQLQRGVKAVAGGYGDSEAGAGARAEGGAAGDYKGRGGGHSSQQEVAVRPKETILSKRKGLSVSGGGGMLVRLGGGVSLSLEDGGGKGMYKGQGTSGGKMKVTQGGGKGASEGGSGGMGGLGGSKHACAKRRTSSEDSSLEPDLAELSLDDGCSLALGAEASNTFEFLPPPPEMLPSPSPLLGNSHKYNSSEESKMFDPKCVGGASAVLPPAEAASPCFPPKETVVVVMDLPGAPDKDLKADAAQNNDEGVEPDDGNQASASEASGKSVQGCKEAAAAAGAAAAAAGGAAANPGAAERGGPAGGEALGEEDYQAYYLSVASEEGGDRQLPDNHQEEEPDIFAGLKPLEQEVRTEVRT